VKAFQDHNQRMPGVYKVTNQLQLPLSSCL